MGIEDPHNQLCRASGHAFYNTSPYDFQRLLQDPPSIAQNLRAYLSGFSRNMREVLERFDLDNTITKLDENGLLFLVVQEFGKVNLHPDVVDNHQMGTIFEELVRRFNEALNENPGEHYTPRDVVRLMARLLIAGDQQRLAPKGVIALVYDPCCGSGGMLTITKDEILALNADADVHLYGQEVNPETWAMSKADLFMVSSDGRDAENIALGSTLSSDQHADQAFHYLITNPPYGKDWRMDEHAVQAEAERGAAGRFPAGTPRISDGQLLFLQHMLARMRPPREGGARVAIIMNGSPLFTGDAGSGESEIRRWVLENDYLDTLIALPEQLFYNTGIATYVWVLTNRKPPQRRGKVQLIDASEMWTPMRKSLGQKRREISAGQIERILALYGAYEEGERVRIYPREQFGYRKVRVERPLRQNCQASPERIARLREERTFQNLAKPRGRGAEKRRAAVVEGRRQQEAILAALQTMPDERYTERDRFRRALRRAWGQAQADTPDLPALNASLGRAIESALSERDPDAPIVRDAKGRPEPDAELREYENVPLGQDVAAYFRREVAPYAADAWIDESYTDEHDGLVGRVGYEINFNRYFYQYEPPRPLEEIEADIEALQREIANLLAEGME
jgi:type I restriction enzyme M protein